MNYVCLNGHITATDQAVVSVMDHGFLYGMGLFETFRTYNGQPFLLEQHLLRLSTSCQSLGIIWNESVNDISEQIQQLMIANQLSDAYIRYTVTAGTDILGLPSGEYEQPTIVIYAKSLPPARLDSISLADHLYTHSKSLRRLHTLRNTPEGDIRLKSLHYMNSILGKRELIQYQDHPATAVEGLMLTKEQYIAEGIVSNVFFVKNQQLYTPAIDTGILPGITRAFVIQLAESAGITVHEGFYTWKQLLEADEVLLTNSIQEIVPVKQLLAHTATYLLPELLSNSMTFQLAYAYQKEAYQQ
ncbi:aminodeoxychorismate lyase [Paenibacillus kyungheensis]|uniref:Aminodeoxychorismate lyase n=1 Tax=Paenibacillus kyungheensis TaxID=1452732 RepID=A0AAX3M3C2_9BACL|nr:aminodeoxychorismate lyase [Paenibacillus kyungheensis]WCT56016.1 aminodeoxychorismate lyase [Paenibacillus kyungheensis]